MVLYLPVIVSIVVVVVSGAAVVVGPESRTNLFRINLRLVLENHCIGCPCRHESNTKVCWMVKSLVYVQKFHSGNGANRKLVHFCTGSREGHIVGPLQMSMERRYS